MIKMITGLKKRNHIFSLLIVIIILSLIILPFSSCTKTKEVVTDEEYEFKNLKTAKVIKGDITRPITLVGRVKPKIKDSLYFEVDGVISYLVAEGDKVKEGDILAEVNSSAIKEDISSKEEELKSAKYEYDKVLTDNHFFEINTERNKSLAKKTYEIAKRAYANSARTKEDKLTLEIASINYEDSLLEIEKQREEYKYKVSEAQEKLNKAQTALNETMKTLEEKTVLYALYDCQIISIDKENNKKITAYEDVITVAGYKDFEVKIQLDEVDISLVKLNMDVDISLDAYKDKELTGKISYISPIAKITEAGVFYDATVDIIDKADIENIYNLTADIDIILEGKKNILIIPEVAISEVAGKKMVEIRNEDKSITQIEIKTGITDYTYTEVISGLNEGDEVVISK